MRARDRLLGKACELFYREGIQAVGIQRLIDEAGIAKASLYAHFPSKDDLVVAYLQKQAADAQALFTDRVLRGRAAPRDKLLALFDVAAELMEGPAYRGCPFQNAGGELADASHPARAVVASYRRWLGTVVTDLVTELDVAGPEPLARAILILFDGAAARFPVEGASAARHARWAAQQLIDAAVGATPSRRGRAHRRASPSR